jgi:hypothetical protein
VDCRGLRSSKQRYFHFCQFSFSRFEKLVYIIFVEHATCIKIFFDTLTIISFKPKSSNMKHTVIDRGVIILIKMYHILF